MLTIQINIFLFFSSFIINQRLLVIIYKVYTQPENSHYIINYYIDQNELIDRNSHKMYANAQSMVDNLCSVNYDYIT